MKSTTVNRVWTTARAFSLNHASSLFVFPLLLFGLTHCLAAGFDESQVVSHPVGQLVDRGQWREARAAIEAASTSTNLDFQTRWQLLYQKERMARIQRDFPHTQETVWEELHTHLPNFERKKFDQWEKDGYVESLLIDGQRHYMKKASINAALVADHQMKHPAASKMPSNSIGQLKAVIANHEKTGQNLVQPKTWQITFTLTVQSHAVPPGEIIRTWLPFAQEDGRQRKVRLISTDPARHVLPENGYPLRSIYLEKLAAAGEPTVFKAVFEYETAAFYQTLDPKRIQPVLPTQSDIAPWLGERPPHIVFSDPIKKLAAEIVGDETNPLLKARRIFAWVHPNVCWVHARDYSTFTSIPEYVLEHHRGDCGMQTLLFMTLCRSQGIPARWESGFMPEGGNHDWCMIYLAPYGWVPVDVTIGPLKSDDEKVKWFYLGGMDNNRLVVNHDYSQPTFPAKMFYRTEPIDFQDGEVEWRGGNLSADQWKPKFEAKAVTTAAKDADAKSRPALTKRTSDSLPQPAGAKY